MKAVILVAGEGRRMHPLTNTRPKAMLPVANKPILEHLLVEFSKAGINEFIFVTGYRDDKVRGYFGDGKQWGVEIIYLKQQQQLGTANAIGIVEEMVGANFLVANSDLIISAQDVIRLAENRKNTMCVVEVKNSRGLGVVELANDRILCILEKMEKPPSNKANAGLYLFTPDIFKAIARTTKSPRGEYEITDSLQLLIAGGEEVFYEEIEGWRDLSYPWDLLSANEAVLAYMEPQNAGEVESNVVLKGCVSIGKNTVIKSGSYIIGPVVIGQDCEIGPNCYIRPSTSIGDHCHIGFAVEVKNSIIMNGSKLPHHNYVGDSIIGEYCNLGAGAKIANLRLDRKEISFGGINTGRFKLGTIMGDRVQVGINASINTGTMIGNNSFIGPGAIAAGVILPDSKIH